MFRAQLCELTRF